MNDEAYHENPAEEDSARVNDARWNRRPTRNDEVRFQITRMAERTVRRLHRTFVPGTAGFEVDSVPTDDSKSACCTCRSGCGCLCSWRPFSELFEARRHRWLQPGRKHMQPFYLMSSPNRPNAPEYTALTTRCLHCSFLASNSRGLKIHISVEHRDVDASPT